MRKCKRRSQRYCADLNLFWICLVPLLMALLVGTLGGIILAVTSSRSELIEATEERNVAIKIFNTLDEATREQVKPLMKRGLDWQDDSKLKLAEVPPIDGDEISATIWKLVLLCVVIASLYSNGMYYLGCKAKGFYYADFPLKTARGRLVALFCLPTGFLFYIVSACCMHCNPAWRLANHPDEPVIVAFDPDSHPAKITQAQYEVWADWQRSHLQAERCDNERKISDAEHKVRALRAKNRDLTFIINSLEIYALDNPDTRPLVDELTAIRTMPGVTNIGLYRPEKGVYVLSIGVRVHYLINNKAYYLGFYNVEIKDNKANCCLIESGLKRDPVNPSLQRTIALEDGTETFQFDEERQAKLTIFLQCHQIANAVSLIINELHSIDEAEIADVPNSFYEVEMVGGGETI